MGTSKQGNLGFDVPRLMFPTPLKEGWEHRGIKTHARGD